MLWFEDEGLSGGGRGQGEGHTVEGLSAAIFGAIAGLIAQIVTTPVRYNSHISMRRQINHTFTLFVLSVGCRTN